MTDIKAFETGIEGLYLIEPFVFIDNRGSFFEAYNAELYAKLGMDLNFVQDNEVYSKKNVLRGMHVNVNRPEGKLIRVLEGEILDVVIDLRKSSNTYLKCLSFRLSQDNKYQLYIPEGIGHGYLALKESRILFKTTIHYIPGDEIAFSWKSRAITVDWGIEKPIQNERDILSKDLSEVWV